MYRHTASGVVKLLERWEISQRKSKLDVFRLIYDARQFAAAARSAFSVSPQDVARSSLGGPENDEKMYFQRIPAAVVSYALPSDAVDRVWQT